MLQLVMAIGRGFVRNIVKRHMYRRVLRHSKREAGSGRREAGSGKQEAAAASAWHAVKSLGF